MNSAWPIATVEELKAPTENALTGGPFGSDLTSADYQDIPGVPVIRGSNMGGTSGYFIDDNFVYVSERKAQTLARNSARRGDLIFTQRGTLGQVVIIPADARHDRYIISQSQMKLTPNPDRVHAKYIFHYFRSPTMLRGIESQTLATGVPHINLGILRRMNVLLPPLAEQQRIADILDRAEALRAKRRAALMLLDSLTQSIFLDLFGDPSLNPNNWPCRSLGELSSKFSDGPFGSNLKSSHYTDDGVRVVRLQNIGVGAYVDRDKAFVSESHFQKLRKHECLPGDVLVATLGDPNLRACIQPASIAVAINKADCVQIRAKPDFATGEFIAALLNSPSLLAMAQDLMHGQTRVRISMGKLRELVVPCPPFQLQKEFERRANRVNRLQSKQAQALRQLDELFASLQHRAFNGTL